MRLGIHVFILAAIGLSIASSPASAASPEFCDSYAHRAVHEFEVNVHTPGCFKGEDLRWHPHFRKHFDWCLGVSPEEAERERDYRRARLRECQARLDF
jgi:hypothetical protein